MFFCVTVSRRYLRVSGLVPEPTSEMEEAQEDDERVPFPGGVAPVDRPLSLRRHERLPVRLRRQPLGRDDADAADDGRVTAQPPAGDAPTDPRAVPRHARGAVQRGRVHGRDGAQPFLSLPLHAPVRHDVIVRLAAAERRDGSPDDVTDDMRHAGHGRHLAWLEHCVPASESVRTHYDGRGGLPLGQTTLQVEARVAVRSLPRCHCRRKSDNIRSMKSSETIRVDTLTTACVPRNLCRNIRNGTKMSPFLASSFLRNDNHGKAPATRKQNKTLVHTYLNHERRTHSRYNFFGVHCMLTSIDDICNSFGMPHRRTPIPFCLPPI